MSCLVSFLWVLGRIPILANFMVALCIIFGVVFYFIVVILI